LQVLTGSLGDVISESAKLAFSWVKANAFDLGLSSSRQQDIASGLDVHLHVSFSFSTAT
jgi:ATP-dependent Lon protease